jgi:hypothetical protein
MDYPCTQGKLVVQTNRFFTKKQYNHFFKAYMIEILILLLLIIFNGLIVMSEIALVSARRSRT